MSFRAISALSVLLAFLLVEAPLLASTKPEPLASMRLMRDERGPLKIRTRSEEGISLRVVFDTAASNSILFDHDGTAGVGRRLDRDYYVYFPFTDRMIDFRQLDWITLQFGAHQFTSNSWVYGPWKSTGLFPGRQAPNYDVIAGRDVFTSFTVAVDPKKRRVQLYESGQDLSARFDAAIDIVDLNPLIAIRALHSREDTGEVAEKLMIIDTGFHGVLLFANEAELIELEADDTTAPADTINDALIARGTIKLGTLPAHEQKVLIVSKGAFEADGVIGTAFLNNYRYAFDLEAKKLYLTALR